MAWYVRRNKEAIPYRLFALSNFGSMLALISYPLLIEPQIALHRQALIWSTGFAAFALVCAAAGWKSRVEAEVVQAAAAEQTAEPPRLPQMIFWIALAACASTLLLSTTTHLTQNIAPIPLLWVLPLSIYLLSFILCFESGRIYQRFIFMPLVIVSFGLYSYGMYAYENNTDVIKRLIPALCGAFFICCMVCHGELARRKPHPRYLTQFYLMVSVGGAIGGLFVALIAPRVFHNYMEMPIAVAACALLASFALWYDEEGKLQPLWMRGALVIASVAFGVYLMRNEIQNDHYYTLSARNFYGVLRVREDAPEGNYPGERVLIHGTINHGTQLLGPNSGRIATSYFGRNSGISRAIRAKQDSGPIHIGILGLGAGVTASLARQQDRLHYYEINPLVREISSTQFSFFNSCPAEKQIYMGDGRLVLERLPSEQLDFLAMDAFSSDAVPMHLLTREAYKIYAQHLKPDGVLAVNISNRYLDLEPVVAQAGSEMGWSGVTVYDDGSEEAFYVSSTWMILSPKADIFNHTNFQDPNVNPMRVRPGFRAWTDDYSNIVKITTGLPSWLQAILP
jgi:hypothetical protein